jgi:penicillin-binding protein 1C
LGTRGIHLPIAAALWLFLAASPALASPAFEEVRASWVKSDSVLLERHGEAIHELRTDRERRRLDWMPVHQVSPALLEAVIAAEDRRFIGHAGVDYRSLGGALIRGLTSEGFRGASTITMQLVALLNRGLQAKGGRKSLWQKGNQILAAYDLEDRWSKDQILEAYLNLITFRGELQGIGAACRGLFGKDPHGLDREEALILASLIRSPNASFSELQRRVSHLRASLGWETGEDEVGAKLRHLFLGLYALQPRVAAAPHVARHLLKDRPHGARVCSNLDGAIQRFALERLEHHLDALMRQNVNEGAVLVVENRTGEVLAYVSHSAGTGRGSHVDGLRARRQVGSALKPFLYAHALDLRILTPGSLLDDSPLDISVPGGIYAPRNFDHEFRGPVSVRVALASSLNVPAVRALRLVGEEPYLNTLRRLGFSGLNEAGDFFGPSLALGTVDASLWELVNGYRTLANGGLRSDLHLTPDGDFTAGQRRIFSREAAFLVSDILSDRDARSATFGLENPLSVRFWAAVKTGTSKDMRDNWCVGYTTRHTVGVWVGNFSGEPMWNVSGVSGAAPLWAEIMALLHGDDPCAGPVPPDGLVRKEIAFPHALEPSRQEWFVAGTEPHRGGLRADHVDSRIAYPPRGAVLAIDPDIPADLQKVFFLSEGSKGGTSWRLDGEAMPGGGAAAPWSPQAGRHLLAHVDREGRTLDQVSFLVRGSAGAPVSRRPFGVGSRDGQRLDASYFLLVVPGCLP